MTWGVFRVLKGGGLEAVASAESRRAAQNRANYRRPIARTETWRVQHGETGEAWECTFEPRKRGKWSRMCPNLPDAVALTDELLADTVLVP